MATRLAPWLTMACLSLCAGAAAQVRPESVTSLFEEAQRYQLGVDRPEDMRKAIDLYLKIAQLDPSHVEARYNLAYLCFVQKRYDYAARYYQEVLRLRPDDADACNNLATVFERQGNTASAMRFYRKAAELSPGMAIAHYNVARLLLDEGKSEEARQTARKALALEPDNNAIIRLNAQMGGTLGRLSNTTMALAVGGLLSLLALSILAGRFKKKRRVPARRKRA
jgi:tetratricopeptide (TPR) repeat protein